MSKSGKALIVVIIIGIIWVASWYLTALLLQWLLFLLGVEVSRIQILAGLGVVFIVSRFTK